MIEWDDELAKQQRKGMARKRYTAEQIIGHLRHVEVMLSQG
jgi:hypothetical protein